MFISKMRQNTNNGSKGEKTSEHKSVFSGQSTTFNVYYDCSERVYKMW